MKRETFIVDTSNSHAVWTGKRLTGFHQGDILISKGSLTIIDGIIDEGNFTFDISSIKVNDIQDQRLNNQLKEHLLSDDFFGADKFPFAVFTIKSALPDDEGNYSIDGDLTIKGITNPLEFDSFVEINKNSLKATAEIIVDRTKYGIRFRSDKFFKNLGDLIIYDNFTLNLELFANADKILETEDIDLSNFI
jgi:polyisoprenoid-binding protein YceI